jgi:signal transduction histidine kinase/PAS domain-containing protein
MDFAATHFSGGSLKKSTAPFLLDGGEMGERLRLLDWAQHSLGHPDTWPQALKFAIRLMLNTRHPMYVFWGKELYCFYNDAYRTSIGAERHPSSIGQTAVEVWSEIWDVIGPQIDQVMSGRGATWNENALIPITRDGRREDVYWTYSYSPIDDPTAPAGVGGVLVVCTETTSRVLETIQISAERERFAELFEQAPTFMAVLRGEDHRIEMTNPGYQALVGHRAVVGQTIAESLPDAVDQGYLTLLNQVYRSGEAYTAAGAKYAMQVTPGGMVDERYVDFVFQPIRDPGGTVTGIFVAGVDVTARAIAERKRDALITLADRLRDLEDADEVAFAASAFLGETLEVSRVSYGTIDPVAETLSIRRDWLAPGIETLAGTLNLRDYGSFIYDLKLGKLIVINDVELDERTAAAAEALKGRSAGAFVNVPVLEQGDLVAVFFLNNVDARAWSAEEIALVQEVAERTRTAAERLRVTAALRDANDTLEARIAKRTAELAAAGEALRQSQKMEAIGQLTGGIAHDFNNLLAGISGSLELLEARIHQGRVAEVDRYITTAKASTRRAAALTQRLLAFARRQTLDPRPVDVNRMLANMSELLNRSVGPNVNLEVVQAGGLWSTKLDGSQLENALLNLCINARDAMAPEGGTITIETANKWLDDWGARERDLPPGQYVSLCVTDTGAGMSPETIAKAFDPFFTTKPLGQGTGLGLSMVYGFVRQSGGQVRVYSEVGKGTTMCLYLPRHVGDAEEIEVDAELQVERGDGETVLIIDDEPAIRMLVTDVLEDNGYRVIEAEDGAAGLKILEGKGRIDLLITDVGLPGGLNGRQVADAARLTRPDLRVLFITGFAENAVVGHGHLDHGMSIITKPFVIAALAQKVRELIDVC